MLFLLLLILFANSFAQNLTFSSSSTTDDSTEFTTKIGLNVVQNGTLALFSTITNQIHSTKESASIQTIENVTTDDFLTTANKFTQMNDNFTTVDNLSDTFTTQKLLNQSTQQEEISSNASYEYLTTQIYPVNNLSSNSTPPQNLFNETKNAQMVNGSRPLFYCQKGEEIRICAFCERTCRHQFQFCGVLNCLLPPKCYCKMGFVRDVNHMCIPAHECPHECCVGSTCIVCSTGNGCVVHDGQPKCVLDSHIVCNIKCTNGHRCIVHNGRPMCTTTNQ